jgi:hypothetical protein|tara:strand:- start:41 stop:469 length:429 start_codon:yes stop_codon:yes gene_type:complete|eukprot:g12893.t1
MAETKQNLENYVNKVGAQQMFGEMLEDVVLERPEKPIDYLINLLTTTDTRGDAEKDKLLTAVWDSATAMVPKTRVKDILRALRSPQGVLSVNFPTHKRQVMACLLNTACDSFVSKEDFISKAKEALNGPGGPNGRDLSLLSS